MSYSRYAGGDIKNLLNEFSTTSCGLSSDEALHRLDIYGYNEPVRKEKVSLVKVILSKFKNPLNIMLIVIALFSLFFGEHISALIIIFMVSISIILGTAQEYRAGKAVEELNALVKTRSTVIRDGKEKDIDLYEVVPGDIVKLEAGDIVAADMRIISCKDLFINQSSLTGESFPIEKTAEPVSKKNISVISLNNLIFMGSSVVSGIAYGLVLKTGKETEFGRISVSLSSKKAKTSFERGINQFTVLMIKLIALLVAGIFCVILLLKRGPFIDALLFSLAVAVGLAPEMLPMLVTINMANGASVMAKKKVIVKKLESIQNFGAMDILCTDKTGTLTMDEIVLERHCNILGSENEHVLKYAYINSSKQSGLRSVMDNAILKHEHLAIPDYKKLDEIPFDFSRKILSVVVDMGKGPVIISKGAPEEIFKRCKYYSLDGDIKPLTKKALLKAQKQYGSLSADGFRVLAVAYRKLKFKETYAKSDEADLVLKGFAAFLDPAKSSALEAIESLNARGVEIKILTGDNEIVTKKICNDVKLRIKGVITEPELERLSDKKLKDAVENNTIFARLTPTQKERIIKALQDNKHTVGYLGDGINDAPSLKTADVGISVNNAVDIAKESASIILLEKNLNVLDNGVIEGRKTFGNIVKYIKMGASSNFGNMLSMAGVTVFLPFLPMLPIQILFNNFLYDLSNVSLPTDTVDEEYLAKPRPWNIKFIRQFVLLMGPLSSIYDFLTYAVMWFLFAGYTQTAHAQALFHTGWFIESLFTQTLVIYIIRTNKIPFIQSMPSKYLLFTTLAVLTGALFVTFSSVGAYLQFTPLPLNYFVILMLMVATYMLLVQKVKNWLIKKYDFV